ncbi:hypothetical protein A0J61_10734 [Choanephora cucurbitarum]|uniref:Uncharacterized protein n=1 Tax=Choanephora cucurbitarum TaxID=101091 RepID=A0A1C7MWM4_9FUNG|nr:hypothetical protein A0J61_10734 [Choanephora cucurbitarum]
MTLNEKPWPEDSKTDFRDTTVTLSNGEVLKQTFFYLKNIQTVDRKGKAKEKTVRYFKGYDLEGKAWKLDYGDPQHNKKSVCCARHFLESRLDFVNQKSALQEVLEDSGYIFELYPKYHCESRLHCDYTFKSLESNLDVYLDKASNIAHIRKYLQKCMDCIKAYSKCDDGREVLGQVKKFVTKTYLSHRKFTLSSSEIALINEQ